MKEVYEKHCKRVMKPFFGCRNNGIDHISAWAGNGTDRCDICLLRLPPLFPYSTNLLPFMPKQLTAPIT
jgi:hypothetical protein